MVLKRPDDVVEPKNANRNLPDAPPPADGKRAAIINRRENRHLPEFCAGNLADGDVSSRQSVDQYTVGPGSQMRYMEIQDWLSIGNVHVSYRMGVDGIGLLLILLTTFLMTLCAVFFGNRTQRVKEYMVFLLLLEAGIIGIFCALDLILFYVFWEAMLIPMYFLIGIFGNARRGFAAAKFFVYQFGGSILMLVAIAAIYNYAGTLNLLELADPKTDGMRTALLHGVNLQTFNVPFRGVRSRVYGENAAGSHPYLAARYDCGSANRCQRVSVRRSGDLRVCAVLPAAFPAAGAERRSRFHHAFNNRNCVRLDNRGGADGLVPD